MSALLTKPQRIVSHDSPPSLWGSMFARGGYGSISPGLYIDYIGEISKDFVQETRDSRFAYLDNRLRRVVLIYKEKTETQTLEQKFRSLADDWYDEIANDPSSSLTKVTSGNKTYLRVISLGNRVIPLILRELESNCAPWFLALQILTGNSDVGKEHAGNFGKIADAWIEWGKANGHLTEQALAS